MSITATHPISFPDEPGLYESAHFPISGSDSPPYRDTKPYLLDANYRFWLAGDLGGPDMSIHPGAIAQFGPYRKLDVETPETARVVKLSATREEIVEFMKAAGPPTHEPQATRRAERWTGEFIAKFGGAS